MANKDFSGKLYDAVENYYHYNPDTLMPMLMVALASQGKLRITTDDNLSGLSATKLDLEEIKDYDWVTLNASLKRQVKKWIKDGVKCVSVEMEIGRSLLPIYKTFKQNDEVTVVQEYHHRIGRLVRHSGNAKSERAQRQHATYVLAEALLNTPTDYLRDSYFNIFNHMLEKSGLQPKRPRIAVARALTTLLDYTGEGLVYNPFAGCSIAGAMVGSRKNYYGDGDTNEKLYAAGLLLNYGMGVSNENFIQRDSTKWLSGKKIDYVLSTYTGYINDNTAFDFCLGKCLEDEQFTGKYAGMVLPSEIFEKQTQNWLEALKRDWISTILLLPFGEVAVLVDANKAIADKGKIRFINGTNPLAKRTKIEQLIEDGMYATIVPTADAKRDGCLKSIVTPTLPDREGYYKVRLGDLISSVPRKFYDLSKVEDEEKVLAFINRQETWYGNRWNENIERRRVNNLFEPAYLLDEDCLVVNSAGYAEPRLFNADNGSAFFNDGIAFSLDGFDDPVWIANELKETYVQRQLHPYGVNEMVPEPLTENDYLNVVLYREIEGYQEEKEKREEIEREKWLRKDAEENALPDGFIIKDGKTEYKIINFISNGSFGYTYRAEMYNKSNGLKEIVALKEYFPRQYLNGGCAHEQGKVVYDECWELKFQSCMKLFRYEPDFIKVLNAIPDNHVTELKSYFESEEIGTVFYSMKYYSGLSLEDMIKSDQVPSSEKLVEEKIVIPLCKALHIMHSNMILHLDIKPENVVIDENGEAVLIDFGVARQYDAEGKLISNHHLGSRSRYSAPEYRGGMKYFSAPADIYGLATTLHSLLYKEEMQNKWEEIKLSCSKEMQQAIEEGMNDFANDRPKNAQQFLRNFPGCENIIL